MDPIEKASILLGKKSNGYVGKASTSLNSTNVTMISGVAMSDSADGSVTVNLDGYTISDKDEQAVEIPTTVSVKAGDTVQISLIGADGTAKSMIVTGVIAGGDRTEAKIDVVKESAENARNTADKALKSADGKNNVYYNESTNPPSDPVNGDLWFKRDLDNAAYKYDAENSEWKLVAFGNQAISNLDAGKITTGKLSAGLISVGGITEDKLSDDITDRINKSLYTRLEVNSTNGYYFKNGEGSTTLTASVFVGSENVTNTHVIKWFRDGEQIATGTTLTVNASDISNKAVFTVSAYKIATNMLINWATPNNEKGPNDYPAAQYDLAEKLTAGKTYIWSAKIKTGDDGDKSKIAMYFGGGEFGTDWISTTPSTDQTITGTFTATDDMAVASFARIYYRNIYTEYDNTGYCLVESATLTADPSEAEITGTVDIINVDDGARGIQGIQGEKGEQGIPGKDGKNGTDGRTTYFHIKYSNVANPTESSQLSETPLTYIGTYVDFNSTDSTDPSKYSWTQFKGSQGKDGENGIPGKNGIDGKTSYLHVAYSNSADGKTGFSVSDSVNKLYIGQYTDFASSDSTDPTKYSWTKIKGETGATGAKGATGDKGAPGAKGEHGDDLSNGTMLYTDPYFANGMNGTHLYDNFNKGNTKIERVAKSQDNPFVNTNYELKITNTGEAIPCCGGFTFGTQCRANAKFIYRVVAKLPSGKPIQFATNDIGYAGGGTWKWLTSRAGTGKFTEYIVEVDCGSSGTIIDTGYFYLDANHGTASNPIEWRVAYATCIDMTGASDAVIAKETANNTKTFFYNDSSGSHVKSKNASSSGTRADVLDDGLHVIDLDDGKELASFTSNGATIGKESTIHSKYKSNGVGFYKGGEDYPYAEIKPITYDNEKYSAAVLTTAPDDISTDDGLYHSGATVDVTAINGTARDNTGVGRVTLTATTVKSADPKEAYIDIFASNNNPNKASGGATGTDTYINMNAEEVYVNGSAISEIGKIYRTTINYTTKTWAQGTWDKTLTLPAGTYIVLSGVDFTDTKTGTYRQYQMHIASGSCTIYPEWLGLYQPANNNSADAYSTVLHVVVATSSCSIIPYIHTYLNGWRIPVNIVAVRIR